MQSRAVHKWPQRKASWGLFGLRPHMHLDKVEPCPLNPHLLLVRSTPWLGNQISYPLPATVDETTPEVLRTYHERHDRGLAAVPRACAGE